MTFLGDLLVALCLILAAWGFGCLVALALRKVSSGACLPGGSRAVPAAVVLLLGFAALSTVTLATCLVGFAPVEQPLHSETLTPQPLLGALLLGSGFFGGALVAARRPGLRAGGRGYWLGVVQASRLSRLAPLSVWQSRLWPPSLWLTRLALPPLWLSRLSLHSLAFWLSLGAVVPWCFLPAFRADETMYHLALPLQYLLQGGLVHVPGHGNSGFVAMGEMLFLLCMAVGSHSAARMLQIVVLGCGVVALGGLLGSRRRSYFAGCLLLSAPVVLWQLPCAYVDIAQATFELVGLAYLWRYMAPPQGEPHAAVGDLYLGALCTGCAAACKYLALAQLPFAGLLILIGMRRCQQARPLVHLTAALLLLCLPCSPYLLHNAWLYGNPLFPFATELFAPSTASLLPAQMQVLDRFMAQFGPHMGNTPLFGLEALWQLPRQLFFQAAFGSARFDGVLGFVPLFIAPLLGLSLRYGSRQRWGLQGLLGGYIGFKLLIWLSTSWQARFLIAPLWASCLLCAELLTSLPRQRAFRAWSGPGVACALGVAQLLALRSLQGHVPGLDARAFGSATARVSLRQDTEPSSRLCDNLAGTKVPVKRLMMVWTQRQSLWCPFVQWSDSYDEAAMFLQVLREAALPGEHLQRLGLSHLLVAESALADIAPQVGVDERRAVHKKLLQYADFKRHDVCGDRTSVATGTHMLGLCELNSWPKHAEKSSQIR